MLTKKQKTVLDYINKYIKKNDYAPTLREIMAHFKLKSVATVHQHIKALEDKGYLKKEEKHSRAIEVNQKNKGSIEVLLVGTIAAGQPIEAIEHLGETVAIPNVIRQPEKTYALKVVGDSMINEGIFNGDIVIIRSQQTANDGQTVVAIIDDNEATLKKIYKEKNQFRLQPANPRLQPLYRNEVEIRGVVIKIIRNLDLFDDSSFQVSLLPSRPKGQLLKWVGNKYKFANEIVKYFPNNFNYYYEPFVGTAAVLATLQPPKAEASDTLKPLIDLWKIVQKNPDKIKTYYQSVWFEYQKKREQTYRKIQKRYNDNPNALDLLFLSRSCYGGVIRFTKEGKMSTPIGAHDMISPDTFNKRLAEWAEKIKNTKFYNRDYKELIRKASEGDLVYCDPPYKDCQSILYGAQEFDLKELIDEIKRAKKRGVKIALSIDGTKKSGEKDIDLQIENGIFEREVFIDCGHSMLRRFQQNGKKMNGEKVKDRLLLTW